MVKTLNIREGNRIRKKIITLLSVVALTTYATNQLSGGTASQVVYAATSYVAVTEGSVTTVTGSGLEANTLVEIMDSAGSEAYGSTRTDADGNFSIKLSKAISAGETITVWVGIAKGEEVVVSGNQVIDNTGTTSGGGSARSTDTGALVLTRYEPGEQYVLATGSTVGTVVSLSDMAGNELGRVTITDTSNIEITLNRALRSGEILKLETQTRDSFIQNVEYVVVDTIGTVKVRYMTTSDESLSNDIIFQGKVAENPSTVRPEDTRHYYRTEQKSFDGYTFVRVEGTVEGPYQEGEQLVTYLYEKESPTPTPDPTPSPEPTPTPDPEPNPTPNPDPTPDPNPDPTPDPNPNPTPASGTQAIVTPKQLPKTGVATDYAKTIGYLLVALILAIFHKFYKKEER